MDRALPRQDRNRTYLVNEAIDAYLDVHQWQIEHIQEGIRQAEDGEFANDAEVANAFSRWRSLTGRA